MSSKEMPNIDTIISVLSDELPEIAHQLVTSDINPSDPRQQALATNPDNPAEHTPLWHQYGILTHSQKFRESMEHDIPRLTKAWSIQSIVNTALAETIQGLSKAELLQIVSMVHDLGKLIGRIFVKQPDGTVLARYTGHEIRSGEIVRDRLAGKLRGLGLQDGQIEYIGLCAERHFELGKAREVAKANGGYTLAYARSVAFKSVAKAIMDANPTIEPEIGLMFIADSISKTELMADADTDEAIEAQRPALEQKITAMGLDSRLINQALQQPVNIEIGKQYLLLWAESQSPNA